MMEKKSIFIVLSFIVSFITEGDALFCYQCLNGELSNYCSLTTTEQQCGNNQDTCLHQLRNENGKLVAWKGCVTAQECSRHSVNPSQCSSPPESELFLNTSQSCTWCCSADNCNKDKHSYGIESVQKKVRVKRQWGYRRMTIPFQRPRVTVPSVAKVTTTTTSTTARTTTSTTTTPVPTTRMIVTMPPDCRQIDIMRCINDFRQQVHNMVLDPYSRFVQFCKSVPDIVRCVTESLHNCTCPRGFAQHQQLLSPVLTALELECPQTCETQAGPMCNSHSLDRIITTIMDINGTCQILEREVTATYQCIALTVTNCGESTFHKFNLTVTSMKKAVEIVCPGLPGDVTTLPPGRRTTTPSPPATSTPQPTPGGRVTTTDTATTTTESSACMVDMGVRCITDIGHKIMTRKSQGLDLDEICKTELAAAVNCARTSTQTCSDPHVHERIELSIIYVTSLTEGACEAKCETTRARSCVVYLYELIYQGETDKACREMENVTNCVTKYTEACTDRERESFIKILHGQFEMINGTCTNEPVKCMGSNETVVLVEGEGEQNLTYRVNIPPSKFCKVANSGCKVYVDVRVDEGQKPLCQDGQQVMSQLAVGNGCSKEIKQDNWMEKHNISVAAKIDFKIDGNQTRVVHLQLRIVENDKVEIIDICSYQIKVVDRDTDSFCRVINDPHMKSLDGLEYDNMYEGFFVLYRHQTLPYEVQVGFQRCEKGSTCSCAVAVRSGDSVFVMNKCRSQVPTWYSRCSRSVKRYKCNIPLQAKTFFYGNITEGTHIYKTSDGRGFEVLLPHGTRVKITVGADIWGRYLLNTFVYPSPFDVNNTEGLCGNYDGRRENDLWIDGKEVSLTWHRRSPAQFCRRWRVAKENLIFRGVKREPYQPPRFCDCEAGRSYTTPPTCSPGNLLELCDYNTDGDVTYELPGSELDATWGGGSRRKRQAEQESPSAGLIEELDFDLEYEPPSSYPENNTWNEMTARQFCQKNLETDYKPSKECKSVSRFAVQGDIDDCVEDIMVSGGTDWIETSKSSLQEQCRFLVEVDINSTNTAVGRLVRGQVMAALCPGDCIGHGQCVDGKCRCETNFLGPDCSLTLDPPIETFLEDNGFCRHRENNCSSIVVYGSQFVQSDKLTCHLMKIELTSAGIQETGEKEFKMGGEYLSFQQVMCKLPAEVKASTGYYVRVSNDGVRASEKMLFFPHDPACFTCTVEPKLACIRNKKHCLIDGRCYRAGETSPVDNCKICDKNNPSDNWSSFSGGDCSSGIVTIVIVVVVVLLIIGLGIAVVVLCLKRRNKEVYPSRREEKDATPGLGQLKKSECNTPYTTYKV